MLTSAMGWLHSEVCGMSTGSSGLRLLAGGGVGVGSGRDLGLCIVGRPALFRIGRCGPGGVNSEYGGGDPAGGPSADVTGYSAGKARDRSDGGRNSAAVSTTVWMSEGAPEGPRNPV